MTDSLRDQELLRRAGRGVPVFPVRTVTASETVRESDAFLLADTTSGSVTLTLPKAAVMKGRLLWTKKPVAANTVTLDGDGSETIDGSTTLAWTTQWVCYTLLSDGSAWYIVQRLGWSHGLVRVGTHLGDREYGGAGLGRGPVACQRGSPDQDGGED